MPGPNRIHLSDLLGAARMVIDATAGVAGIVETMHRTIQLRPGALGPPATDALGGITGLVYRGIRDGIRLVGQGIDAGLAPAIASLPEGESALLPDALRSAVNGLHGDYLVRSRNPLAIDMSLRYRGRRVDPSDPTRVLGPGPDAAPTGKLLILVHGLCMNERQWSPNGRDHGAALAEELGYTPLHLRYNSGLRVASNGSTLAQMLETVVERWPQPVQDLVVVGHSMGGLVARSACHHGGEVGHAWLKRLSKLVFLATPHHGAPLERGGHWLESVMELSPYSAPFARIGKVRSAGITDLRYGSITAGAHELVPLPTGVGCYAVGAILGTRHGVLSERLVGDGVVPLDSALGRHSDAARTLAIPRPRQWIGYEMGHLGLLNRPEVYARLRTWLQETA